MNPELKEHQDQYPEHATSTVSPANLLARMILASSREMAEAQGWSEESMKTLDALEEPANVR